MKPSNSLTKTNENQDGDQAFSKAIVGKNLQSLIRRSLPDAASAARFTGSLISAVASSPQLRGCIPATIVAAALRGEGQGLALGREYHLVPFGKSCTYVISYKGLIALALSTGEVADMDCIEVRDGEYVGRDQRTKRPKFDFSVYATDEESEAHPIIGYMAYVELHNGYFRAEYMRIGEILDHAERYSKNFDRAKYDAVVNGLSDHTPAEIEQIRASSPWYGSFDSMAKKTVLRRLLNSGYVRLANNAVIRDAMSYDSALENEIVSGIEIPMDPDPRAMETSETDDLARLSQEADNALLTDRRPDAVKNTPERRSESRRAAKTPESAVPADDPGNMEESFFS